MSHGSCTQIWWAWNANSGDTGGIVDDNWDTVIFQKMRCARTNVDYC